MSNTQSSNLIMALQMHGLLSDENCSDHLRFGRHYHVKNPHPIFSCEKKHEKIKLVLKEKRATR
jgi:hypothetical protein